MKIEREFMGNKSDHFYFENLVAAAECSQHAADYLVECLEHYEAKQLKEALNRMHEFEHAGDQYRYEMLTALAKAFVTPVEREDLLLISSNIDEVTDRVEEVLQRFYVDEIQVVMPDAMEFARKLADCCETMRRLVAEFINFKKPAKLQKLVEEVKQKEEDCDKLYLKSTMKLSRQCKDVLEILYWREIYEKMEDCADACEHVSECVEMVVMKNT